MNMRRLLIAATIALACRPACAQFEAEEPLAPAPTAANGAAGAGPAARRSIEASRSAALADSARRDPIVAAALELPRETPVAKARYGAGAGRSWPVRRRRPVAARLLTTAPIDDAQRTALVREFGSARFMQLIRLGPRRSARRIRQRRWPGVGEFAQNCLDAAAAEAARPRRALRPSSSSSIAPTEDDRYAARVDLAGVRRRRHHRRMLTRWPRPTEASGSRQHPGGAWPKCGRRSMSRCVAVLAERTRPTAPRRRRRWPAS